MPKIQNHGTSSLSPVFISMLVAAPGRRLPAVSVMAVASRQNLVRFNPVVGTSAASVSPDQIGAENVVDNAIRRLAIGVEFPVAGGVGRGELGMARSKKLSFTPDTLCTRVA